MKVTDIAAFEKKALFNKSRKALFFVDEFGPTKTTSLMLRLHVLSFKWKFREADTWPPVSSGSPASPTGGQLSVLGS